jgi:beta-phosphoglucomutase-like phosphatase (HAD superfamily)
VATATDERLAAAALLRTGLQKYLCGICTCEIAGIGKEDPSVFDAALELLGTPREETIVFEDAPHAVKTAKCAGYSVCAVFDESADKPETLRQIADYYIFDFAEAKALFL